MNHHSGVPVPRLTVRGFEVNPSPHELAIGALEQWRRSKLSKAWKNVLVSLSKGPGRLCIWRDAIGHDGSNYMELLQQVNVRDMQHIQDEGGILRISLAYSAEEPLTFRCMDEPSAINQWVTTLRTVTQYGNQQAMNQGYGARPAVSPPRQAPKAAAPAPAIDLLSFDVPHGQNTPDLLSTTGPTTGAAYPAQQPQIPQQQRPVHYQTYPNANGFPSAQQQRPMYGQPQPNHYGQQPGAFQQPNTNQPQFSQPPPLPFPGFKRPPGGFPVQQPNNGFTNQHPHHSRSLTPTPRQTGRPAHHHHHNMHQARSVSPVPRHGVPLANQFPQPPPKLAPQSVPRPGARKQTPRRSLSAPPSPLRPGVRAPGSGPATPEEIKKHIIQNWAVAPPAYTQLKPLMELVRTIPKVFPPQLKLVEKHEYFTKWKPVTSGEFDSVGVDKIVRKLRFFLHPDKLPQDFSQEQIYLCKCLWDVINDAQQKEQHCG